MVSLSRQFIRSVRRLDEFELRRLLILVRGLLIYRDGQPAGGVDDVVADVRVTYRQEYVRCGKDACTTCPHGPYWYAYWRENGRTRSQYIGRHLPGEPLEPVVPVGDRDG